MATATYMDLLTEVRPRPIRSAREHSRALAIVEKLIDKAHKSVAERDMVELLATLISQYEERQSPPPEFTSGERLKFCIEQRGVSQTELAHQTGVAQSTIANVIAGRRELSKANISALARFFKLPPSAFME